MRGFVEQPYGAASESGSEYRLPAMALPSDGNQTSYRVRSTNAAKQLQGRVMTNIEQLKAQLVWIDSVPRNAELPAMPGFDRDDVNELIEQCDLAD